MYDRFSFNRFTCTVTWKSIEETQLQSFNPKRLKKSMSRRGCSSGTSSKLFRGRSKYMFRSFNKYRITVYHQVSRGFPFNPSESTDRIVCGPKLMRMFCKGSQQLMPCKNLLLCLHWISQNVVVCLYKLFSVFKGIKLFWFDLRYSNFSLPLFEEKLLRKEYKIF